VLHYSGLPLALLGREEAWEFYPVYDRFAEIRQEMDPNGIFANQLVRDLFGYRTKS
jgi:FAD/FMN-containing dehydrogenase